jgi:hypothetical protein
MFYVHVLSYSPRLCDICEQEMDVLRVTYADRHDRGVMEAHERHVCIACLVGLFMTHLSER